MKLKLMVLAATVVLLFGVSSKLFCPHMGGGGMGGHIGGGMGHVGGAGFHGAAMHSGGAAFHGAAVHGGFAGAHAVGHAGFAHGQHGFHNGHGFHDGHREFRNGGWGWWIGGVWYPCDDPFDPYCNDPYSWWF